MKLIELTAIKIAPNRQRQLFEPASILELSNSIQEHSLLQPIVLRIVGENYVLVCGERRVRAVSDLHDLDIRFLHDHEPVRKGFIPYVNLGDLDPLAAEEAELEENIRRSDLSWQERAQATDRLAKLREAQALAANLPSPTNFEIGQEAHREQADPSKQRLLTKRERIVAANLHKPEVRAAKTLDEAFKILVREESTEKNRVLAEIVGKTFSAASHTALNEDSLAWMKACLPETFDVILTDPPYGMGADEFGDAGGRAAGAHGYEDTIENFGRLMDVLVNESFRIAKPQAHLYVFCDLDNFTSMRRWFTEVGWTVFRTPLIWYKKAASRAPLPYEGPQRKYETILYAIKGHRHVLEMKGDVLEYPADDNLGHAAQKPAALFLDLIQRSCRPGDLILDPFVGTGSIFPAAHAAKCIATGIEQEASSFGIAVGRLEQLKKEKA